MHQTVLDNITLDFKKRTITTIFGPNGSGKTTLLNIIAGILKYDSGTMTFSNSSTPLNIGFAFQDYYSTILPWYRAIDNISLPLRIRGIGENERNDKVKALLRRFDVELPLSKYPYQLSGGQNQMISTFRAILTKPDLLVMDEPTKSFDYNMKLRFTENLLQFLSDNKMTTIIVSHDIDESIFLSDRIVVLSNIPSRILEVIHINLLKSKEYKDILDDTDFRRIKETLIRLSSGY